MFFSSSQGCVAPGPANSSIADCKNQTKLLLDHCDKIGMKVMLDVAATFRTIVCGPFYTVLRPGGLVALHTKPDIIKTSSRPSQPVVCVRLTSETFVKFEHQGISKRPAKPALQWNRAAMDMLARIAARQPPPRTESLCSGFSSRAATSPPRGRMWSAS